jgi:hypothetical protein
MDMISFGPTFVVPIHLMKELVFPHLKNSGNFVEILENIPVK